MKFVIVIFGLLGWIGCGDEITKPKADIFEADAVWTNMLAVDGCSWHFSVTSKDSTLSLVPDNNSLEKVEAVVGKLESAYSFTNVRIKYSLTGKKSEVKCGWGKTADFDKINIIEISKR